MSLDEPNSFVLLIFFQLNLPCGSEPPYLEVYHTYIAIQTA